MNIQLVTGDSQVQIPAVSGDVKLTLVRRGTPGKLTFTAFQDGVLSLTEGDPVALTVEGTPVFYGFVFTKKRGKSGLVEVTAYDQMRYLKATDTVNFENWTASQLLQAKAADFGIQLGDVADTGYVIPAYGETDISILDAIYDALDETLAATGELFVLYDDFGRLCLQTPDAMQTNLLIEAGTAEDFDYQTSIDENTYNKIKLTFENKDEGVRSVYIAQDSGNIAQWGVLQYHEDLSSNEGAQGKADALLSYYNRKTRKLQIQNAAGDLSVKAGSTVGVYLLLDDMTIQNYMMVEEVTHTFSLDKHVMDLTLIGGDFVG